MPIETDKPLQQAVAALAGPGWGVVDDFLPATLWQALARRAAGHRFHAAGIGRRARQRTAIRGDAIHWLEAPLAPEETAFLERVEALRLAINRALWLGLLDFECHYARYPVGARYARHHDRPADRPERTVTLICYLNHDWRTGDGGALRIHLPDRAPVDVLPVGGRAVVFLSERFEHEVLPARRPRLALTGWYRRRPHGGRAM